MSLGLSRGRGVMGRRSAHTATELRELIISAATELIESSGFAGLSAREIARRIEYSPGTLYNVFENIDDLVLTIEGRLLDRLTDEIRQLPDPADPEERVHRLASTYLQFTHDNPKLWNLLFEHHLPAGQDVPDWYQEKLDGLLALIEDALKPLLTDTDPQRLHRAARVLWAGVHGITSLSTTNKLGNVTTETATPLVEDLVRNYIAGLTAKR